MEPREWWQIEIEDHGYYLEKSGNKNRLRLSKSLGRHEDANGKPYYPRHRIYIPDRHQEALRNE